MTHLVTRLAAAEAVATSADEEVVCEGEKTREERDAESYVARPCCWTSEAVSLDNFGGMRSSLRGARVGARQ